jgi:hypothetical protein
MSKINIGRLILGGVVAGIVGNVLGYLADGLMFAPQWNAAMKALGRSEFSMTQLVGFNVIGLIYGVLTIWLYAAIRPRYGAGPKTAVYAGLAAWAIGVLLPNVALMAVTGLYPTSLTTATTTAAIVESVAGALAGAALYREAAGEARSSAARA